MRHASVRQESAQSDLNPPGELLVPLPPIAGMAERVLSRGLRHRSNPMDERALHKSIGYRRSRFDAAERGLPRRGRRHALPPKENQ
jgi:hypothetical protein